MGGGGGGGGGPLSATLFGWTGGVTTFGISTNTRKIFRPVPSYFVSSLIFKTSVRRVGSSDCVAFCCFPPARLFEEALGASRSTGSGVVLTFAEGAAALDEPNPKIP